MTILRFLVLAPLFAVGGRTVHAPPAGGEPAGTPATGIPALSATVVIDPVEALERRLCVAAAAGPAAAFECGDLVVRHVLPGVQTMSTPRAPVLVYNSRAATATVRIPATVTFSGSAPAAVTATVTVAGSTLSAGSWSGWGTSARRITAVIAPTSLASGTYDYTLRIYGDGVERGSAAGKLQLVNESASAFGAGWSMEGLERLTADGTAWNWRSGDGSARRYTQVSTDVWVAPFADRPDTLKRVGGVLRRVLRGGGRVEFNDQGFHTRTVNRNGHYTEFTYSSGLVASVSVHVNSGTRPAWTFTYTSGRITSIMAPGNRQTNFTVTGGRLVTIAEPGGVSVQFAYQAAQPLMSSRTNRRGIATAYLYGDAATLARYTTPLAGGAQIRVNFTAAEAAGAAPQGAVTAASAYTIINGPRADTTVTKIWINRFGAPTTIENALGAQTVLLRQNATFPALVTRVTASNGLVTRAGYNSRGLILADSVMSPYGDSRNAITVYQWHATLDAVTRITQPEGEFVEFGYDANGNRLWQQDNRGSSSRVNFSYSGGQLASVTEPGGSPDSLFYDAMGNVSQTRSPSGKATFIVRDGFGRDTLVQIGFTKKGSTFILGTTRKIFDARDRVTQQFVSGPAESYTVNSTTPDTAAIHTLTRTESYGYDAEDNLLSVSALGSPDLSNVAVNESLKYDNANRLVRRSLGTGPDSIVYDPAGNATALRHKSGVWVPQRFDALNRVTLRVVPQRDYSQNLCAGIPNGPLSLPGNCNVVFPYYPNNGSGLRVFADTSTFQYDVTGNLTRADNRYARIRRSYFPVGQIATDTTRFGQYATPQADGSVRVASHTYDRSGRRLTLTAPSGTLSYSYHSFGPLYQIIDPLGNQYRYGYDASARINSLQSFAPGSGTPGVSETRTYDSDGRLAGSNRTAGGNLLVGLGFSYSARDKITSASYNSMALGSQTVYPSYDALGALIAFERVRYDGAYQLEEYRNDAFGNVYYSRRRASAGTNDAPYRSEYGPTGELMDRWSIVSAGWPPNQREEQTGQQFMGSGLVLQTQIERSDPSTVTQQIASRHYYGADDRVMAVQRYVWNPGTIMTGSWEEYRYDALGRRIMTRARRDPNDKPASSHYLCNAPGAFLCWSYFQWTQWDGDQALYEWRVPEYSSGNENTGEITFVNSEVLDQPVAVIRNAAAYLINYDFRGLAESAITPSGTGGGPNARWPAVTQGAAYYTPNLVAGGGSGTLYTYVGSVIENGAGSAGMLYRRNRYYDAQTGRFTQADPIGLAGGMNLYGFGDGDPVNNRDPFGLCPIEKDGIPCSLDWGVKGGIAGAATGALVGATAGTLVVPGVGTIVGAGGGAATFGFAGLMGGATAGAARDLASAVEMSGLGDRIGRKIHRAIETAGFVIGLIKMSPPPQKPEDDHKPPPPAPTSTKSLAPDDKEARRR